MARAPTVTIVGAGFAGAATAWHLARGGARVVMLEREAIAGAHASSQNAGILRTCIADAALARIATAGARGPSELQPGASGPILRPVGALLVADAAAVPGLRGTMESSLASGRPVRWLGAGEAAARVPLLRGARLEAALLSEADGVLDVAAYLDAYVRGAREAGAEIRFGSEMLGADRAPGGGFRVRSTAGTVEADVVVIAAGAWSDEAARRIGAGPLDLVPHRRHLHATGPIAAVDPSWPFVWSVGEEVYFRPESGGLLLSACDEEPFAACEPPADPANRELLAGKVARAFPRLVDLPIMRSWAGLRTFPPDRRFVLGWEPGVAGVLWVAGLGGHGVTSSWEVGRAAAAAVLRGEAPPSEFDPARFRRR